MDQLPDESLHEFVLRALKNRGKLSLREIGEDTEISKRSIEKILSGETPNPGVRHIEKLAGYFRASASERS
jgi:transcriptional regulator with XRE-family HTH domain